MNVRQKAKKYKRLYEALLQKSSVKVKLEIHQHNIDTLRFERYYPRELILGNWSNSSYLRDVMIKSIADGFANTLAENFDKYINYYTEFCPNFDKYHFVGEMKVVDMEVKR